MQFFEWWERFSWAGVVEVAINSAWLFGFETAKKLTDCQRSLELHVGHMVSLNMRDTSKWPSTMAKLIHFFPTIFRQSPWYYRKPATVVVKAGVLGTVRAPYLMVKIMLSEGNRSELILFQVGKPLQSIHQYAWKQEKLCRNWKVAAQPWLKMGIDQHLLLNFFGEKRPTIPGLFARPGVWPRSEDSGFGVSWCRIWPSSLMTICSRRQTSCEMSLVVWLGPEKPPHSIWDGSTLPLTPWVLLVLR